MVDNTIAQDLTYKYPLRFSIYRNAGALVNPANAGCYFNNEITIGSLQMLGAISNVSASYFTLHMRLQKARAGKPYSMGGVVLYNDHEGKYLSRTRAYVSYAWHASLSPKLNFSAGLYAGGMNYSVKGTPLSGNGSDTKVDGAVGVSLYSKVFHADISFGQLFNSKIQPLEEIMVLAPMMNISASTMIKAGDLADLIPSFTSRIPLTHESNSKFTILSDFNMLLQFRQKLLLSAGLHNNTMMALSAGMAGLKMFNGEFVIQVSYSFPLLKKAYIRTNFGEAGLAYCF